jgi:hypothetical protein
MSNVEQFIHCLLVTMDLYSTSKQILKHVPVNSSYLSIIVHLALHKEQQHSQKTGIDHGYGLAEAPPLFRAGWFDHIKQVGPHVHVDTGSMPLRNEAMYFPLPRRI